MRKGWKEVRLDSIAEIIMGLSPKGDTYNEKENGVPLLNGPTEFGETYPNCTLYTTDPKRICKKGDLIFCVRGSTTGRMNWADREYALGRGVCSITGVDYLTTKYIKQLLSFNLSALLQITGGGTFPNLRKEDINGFKFKIPTHYRKIARILSAYDDLIENNLKRIKLLEEKAQLTYEEWFVRMKFPGHETTPINEETGLPEGWHIGELSELINFQSGYAYKSSKFRNEGFPIIKIKNIDNNTIDVLNVNFIDIDYAKKTEKFKLTAGDLLIAMTGATVGKVGILPINSVSCYLNQRVGRFLKKGEIDNNSYVWCFFTKGSGLDHIMNIARGAAQPNISSSQILSIKLAIPSIEILQQFSDLVQVYTKEILNFQKQNQLLKEARDILLPRLMSGMIDVDEIELENIGVKNGTER